MSKLLLRPENASYAVERGEENLRVDLGGGLSRVRKDIVDAASKVNVDFKCSARQFEYLNAFHRTATDYGSLPFTMDLIIDTPDLVTYNCKFIKSLSIGQRGATYYVSTQIEAEAIVGMKNANPAGVIKLADTTIIANFEANPNP